MNYLIEFVSLRPIWTRRGIEVVWYVYLVATLIQLLAFLGLMDTVKGFVFGGYRLPLFSHFLFLVAHLALVRIFLEMALKFLIPSREDSNATPT